VVASSLRPQDSLSPTFEDALFGAVGLTQNPTVPTFFSLLTTTLAAKPVVATIVYSPQSQAPAGTTLCEAREWLMGAIRHFFQPFMR
jgi:hypothetical protein